MPDKHQEGLGARPSSLPGSLMRAHQCVRPVHAPRAGPAGRCTSHNSMLVHVTRFQDVQSRVAEQISEHLRRCRTGSVTAIRVRPVEEELRALWETDFVPDQRLVPRRPGTCCIVAKVWDRGSTAAAEKIQVRVVNGTSRDALQYYDHRQ